MADTQVHFEAALRTLSHVESLMHSGVTIDDACDQAGIDRHTVQSWADHLSLPPDGGAVLSASPLPEAVFPIFASSMPNSPIEHIGSGVAVHIGDELFAFTAAHVTDHGGGELYMPAADSIESMTGGLSYSELPSHGSRIRDKGDMAYFRLTKDWLDKIHPSIKPLTVDDLMLTDELQTGDLFTFVGYPWRKTKSRNQQHETDRTTYTGHASAPDVYARLEYDRFVHVVVRVRRKKTYSTRYHSYQTAPHPQGISGGAVIAWPWTFAERHDPSQLKLAAIGHTYHQHDHCLVATREIPYVMAIVRNNPCLAEHFRGQECCEELEHFLAEAG